MKNIVKIILFSFTISINCFSQKFEDKAEKLKQYKTAKINNCKSYGDWSYIYKLENGLVVEEKVFSGKTPTLVQKNIYDQNNNILFEIRSHYVNNKYTIDTTFRSINKYDDLKRLVEKKYVYGMVEKFSDFNEFSQPRLIERFNDNGETLYLWPISEKLEYDSNGNLITERKTEIEYPETKNDTIRKLCFETNFYKYDSYGNVVEIRRQYDPKQDFPIIIYGGFSLYEIENFKYKFNKEKIWIKKYWIVNGKKMLIKKRKFTK